MRQDRLGEAEGRYMDEIESRYSAIEQDIAHAVSTPGLGLSDHVMREVDWLMRAIRAAVGGTFPSDRIREIWCGCLMAQGVADEVDE